MFRIISKSTYNTECLHPSNIKEILNKTRFEYIGLGSSNICSYCDFNYTLEMINSLSKATMLTVKCTIWSFLALVANLMIRNN